MKLILGVLGVLTTHALCNVVRLGPIDCDSDGDCWGAIHRAISKCHGQTPCSILLAPGRYRVVCPGYTGDYPYIRTPGAVDLSHLSGVTFGGESAANPAMLDIDYVHNGCPAVGSSHGSNLTIQNLVLDTTRLPFTDATVLSTSDGGREITLKMKEPNRTEWNVEKYPWLRNW